MRSHPSLPAVRALTPEERDLVTRRFNDTERALAHETLADLLEAQADATPHRVALVFDDQELTYAALHARANRLARVLQARGVGPDVLVGISLRRTLDLVPALLAVAKAGGAWLPLDPAWPAARLASMREHAGVDLVLTDDGDGGADLATLWAEARGLPAAVPPRAVRGHDLAYCLYTSGSTGLPRCAQVLQVGLVNMLEDARRDPGYDGRRWLATTTLNFDFSVMEILIPLACGGTVLLAPDGVVGDPDALLACLERHRPDVLSWPPALWPTLLDSGWRGHAGMRLLTAGEPLSASLAERLLACGQVYNYYGPCETSVYCTWHRVTHAAAAPPVGRPGQNMRVYILDEDLEPVPVGAVGELFVGGVGVGRGYLGAADLTEARYLPDPFVEGARVFRTGDRARWRSDGCVEVLGRLDHQVKLRGVRIEPAEVEATLREHPAVRDAVVGVRGDGPQRRLVAWVACPRERPEAADLRAFVTHRLPPHLVPSSFVVLEALPVTAGGKIDRKALPAPPDRRADGARRLTPTEAAVASVFEEVLGARGVTADDDFFALGGDSLLAMRATARVRTVLGCAVGLRALFDAPTPAALARALGPLPDAPQQPPAPPRAPVMSFEQQQLWLAHHLQPLVPLYNEAHGLRLHGPLDTARLAAAVNALVTRHEVLRTVFPSTDGQPRPVVQAPTALALAPEDVASEAEADALAAREAGAPFDLEAGPLLRVRLLRLGERHHLLLLVMHHIACDGWSLDVIWRDLASLYEGCPPPPLPLPYAAWAAMRREALDREARERLLRWWAGHLDGVPHTLDLPLDRRRRPASAAPAGLARHTVEAVPAARLKAFAAEHGSTGFMVLLAAFEIVLHRWTGEPRLLVGTPVAGRDRIEVEGLVGYFVNMVALRSDLDDAVPAAAFLARTRENVLRALEHADLPFPLLVERLQPDRTGGRHPLFEVVFALRDDPVAPDLGEVRAEPFTVGSGAARFDLDLSVQAAEQGLRCVLEYRADLFDPETMALLLRCYETVLDAMMSDPARPAARLPLMTDEARRHVLHGLNPPACDAPPACLHHAVETAARRQPHAPAICDGARTVTYGELDQAADRLAARLRLRGVGAESRVGLHLARSVDQIVAMLAILKAGGAYVPLDPAWPAERTVWIASDASLGLIVSDSPLETPAAIVPPHGPAAPDVTAEDPRPDSAAYVIYTSGSSGQPKGVLVEHRTAARYVDELAALVGLAPGDRVLQFTTASFDVSVEEIFGTLGSGATLVLRDDAMLATMADFLARCDREGVTVLDLPTAFWHDLAAALDAEELSLPASIRAVLIGGERAMPERVAQWRRRVPARVRLLNGYGPTEATVAVSFWEVPGTWDDDRECPIGPPMPHVRAYVLDAHGEPLPPGFAGELHVGGACLARGYLDRPRLTAERFVDNPFGEGRLYRTGDRARWRADGVLEFCGRIDRQVKIRGFRVEPGEVEAALERHPSVREAAVETPPDASGRPHLVAWVGASGVDAADLRAWARRSLPDPLVPRVIVVLEALPRTPAGKVDRTALPAPPPPAPDSARIASPAERVVAAIWCSLLDLETVGRHDDFFEVGGHSLLAAQVIARVRAAFGVTLTLADFFEAPTVAGLAARIATAVAPGGHPLRAVPRDRALPLSPAQLSLWLVDRMAPQGATYNVPLAFRLRGRLVTTALQRALDALVQRHETLRTTFVLEDGRPAMRIDPPAPLPLAIEAVDEDALPARLDALSGVPFDLGGAWPVRAHLLAAGPRDHVLLLVFHHIAFDGWSADVVVDELNAHYPATLHGETATLPALPLQYADFAAWQREALHDAMAPRLAWWRDELATLEPTPGLPTDRPRPAHPRHRGGVATRRIGAPLAAAVRALTREHEVTLFVTLLTAFDVLLHRWSGRDQLVVGTPVADRTRLETERLIGYFVDMLPMRADLAGDPSFAEALRRVREHTLRAYAHCVPFAPLVEHLAPRRDPSHHPLFQAAFSLQRGQDERRLQLPDVEAEPLAVSTGAAKFDLDLAVTVTDEGFACRLEYDADLFDASTAARLLEHLENLLRSATGTPSAALSRLTLMSAEETRLVTQAFNRTTSAYPRERSLAALFLEQAARTPNAVAVEMGEARLTYATLARRAGRLAGRLCARGVGHETRVGLLTERSLDMVVAIVAVLQAGGAYVPLDPTHPDAHLARLQADADASLVLAPRHLAGRVPPAARPLWLDEEGGEPLRGAGPAGPDSLACLMYTSGSSGQPKGVAVEHRGIVRLVRGTDYARFASDEVFLQAAPLSFDASTFEIWGALLHGARLVLAPPGQPSLEALGRLVRERGVTTLWLTAGLFHLMVESRLDDLRGLRQLLAGGDVLSPQAVARVRRALPHVRLVNGYGPTENTTFTACHTVTEADDDSTPVPIGRPVANTRVYVVDRHLQPQPLGVPGELCAAGDGVARGYWNQPALTEARFVRGPQGERVYRTGDLARWRPDGTLEFMGRLDRQVKIRGFRVEPAGIEAALSRHPQVRGCAVAARPGADGQPRLVAWVTTEGPDPGLRAWLAERVPDFMIPAAVVAVEALPLTAQGKVDVDRLPDPPAPAPASGPPRTPTQQIVAAIVGDVLGVASVGLRDDFFTLGGHSLAAVRVLARIQTELEVTLSMRTLFEGPTVAALAAAVDSAGTTPLPPLRRQPRDRQLPVSWSQLRMWLGEQMSEHGLYNIPVAVRLRGRLAEGALQAALDAVVARHEILRTVYAAVDGEPTQVVRPPAPVVVEHATATSDAQARACAAAFARRPFDLAGDPMLRACLIERAHDDHVLVMVLHHIAADGWSLDIILEEMSAVYGAAVAGRAPGLPSLGLQYADFACWQREAIPGEVLEAARRYWVERLADAPAALDLPTDRARPAVRSGRGGEVRRTLPKDLLAQVGDLCRAHGVTPFMALLAAFQVLLHRWSGQDDVVVATPVTERPHAETEPLIGFFVNTLMLRADCAGDPPFAALLARTRHDVLGACAHQALPFEQVVEALRAVRPDAPVARPTVAFNLQSEPAEARLRLPGVEVETLDVDLEVARHDLSLNVVGGTCTLEYDADVFTAATAERLLEHYENLLRGASEQPQSPIGALPLMGAHEQARLAAYHGRLEHPPATPAPTVIARQWARRPSCAAVGCGDEVLTYAQLERRSRDVARLLLARGVGRGARVGVCTARGVDMVAALLGIWRSGAAYVPIDPAYPAQRLAMMFEDADMPLVLTQRALRPRLEGVAPPLLCLDDPLEEAPDVALPTIEGDDLAYVIFTSGSTGRPKGVEITHGALANFLRAMATTPGFDEQGVLLAVTTLSFDIAGLEIFLPLWSGGRVALATHDEAVDGARLAALAERIGATMLQATPATWRLLIEAGWEGRPNLTALCGGEAMPAELAEALRTRCAVLWNMYGPTETTIWSTIDRVGDDITIGRPIDDTLVYVLDAHLRPQPPGIVGELHIGGAGVARGYLGQPALTAARFVPDPFCGREGARMYKTGDLARFVPDGRLQWMGRIDGQVKLHGFRIETGDVETHLCTHDDVERAVVEVRGEQLVAWYIAAGGREVDPEILRQHLAGSLPPYMVPSVFTPVAAMPLTPNGKIDRRALPSPEKAAPSHVPPRDDLERTLAEIWEDVLERQVGVTTGFFELGGHSLSGARVVARIERELGRRITLATLFGAQTVARLAAVLRGDCDDLPARGAIVDIQPAGTQPPLFWVHSLGGDAGGGFLYYRELARLLGPQQPSYGIRAPEQPHDDVEAMAEAYVDALVAARPEGSLLLGGFCFGGVVAYEMARRLRRRGRSVELLVLIDSTAPLGDDEGWSSIFRRGARVLREAVTSAQGAADLPRRARRLLRRLRGGKTARPRLEDVLDVSAYPPDYLEAARRHWDALQRYTAGAYEGEVALFSQQDGGALGRGWARLVGGPLHVHAVPARHEDLLSPPHVGQVAEVLRALLADRAR